MPDEVVQAGKLPSPGTGEKGKSTLFLSLGLPTTSKVRLYRSGKNVNHAKPAGVFLLGTNTETTGTCFC